MKLTIFESDSGDCLLLEAASRHLVLCDGGMRASMQQHVRAELARLGRPLDLVYVSHIDNDHISGVLQLLEDAVEWEVFDLHEADGDPIRKPKVPRPPKIEGILHNAFRDQVKASQEQIKELLVAAAPTLYATGVRALVGAADEMQGIAAGIPEALKVSRLAGPDALAIPVNNPLGVNRPPALLVAGGVGDRFDVGSMRFTLVGPTKDELDRLGKGWINWLRSNAEKVKQIRAELKKRIEAFSNGALEASPYDLRDWNGIPDVDGVTAPNVASLTFMVEEDGKRLLLTGDGQQRIILDGLVRTGFLEDEGVHLDVLKVQHHGSENNLDPEFAQKVSADHYVFCGNGLHGNPEAAVIDMIYASRLSGDAGVRALAPKAEDRPFHFWFSTTSAAAPAGLERRETFEQVEAHVAALAQRSRGRLQLHFNGGASTVLAF
jgi:beta-lactamase superfamily II metal-dependent hydrolase